MKHIDGNQYLRALIEDNLIHNTQFRGDKISIGRTIFGEFGCCSGKLDKPIMFKGSIPALAEDVRRYSKNDIALFESKMDCRFVNPEPHHMEDIEKLKKCKKQLEKELKKLTDSQEREEIERELKWIRSQLVEFRAIGCTFDIPPAWYESYRTSGEWGIHIIAPLLATYTRSIYSSIQTPHYDIWQVQPPKHFYHHALECLLEHESFHFAFNIFIDKCEKFLYRAMKPRITFDNPILYKLYTENVYKEQSKDASGADEEALASAWEFASMSESLNIYPLRWTSKVKSSIKSYHKMMKNRGPEYSSFHKYISTYLLDERKHSKKCISLLDKTIKHSGHNNKVAIKGVFSELSRTFESFIPLRSDIFSIQIPIWIHYHHYNLKN